MRARTLLLFACAALVGVFWPAPCRAQSDTLGAADTGMGGRHTIEGRIFLPSGRRADRRMRVRLSGSQGEMHSLSDDNGAFTFRRLNPGTYRVTVEAGQGFEAASESVDIFDAGGGPPRRAGTGQVVNVQFHLRPKANAAASAPPGVINAALAAVPAAARGLYEKALRASHEGDHRKAVEHLKAALAAHADFALAYNELGAQYMKLGEPKKAAEAFRQAIRLAPEVALLHLNYAILLVSQREYEGAEKHLRYALLKDGANPLAHLYLGRVLVVLARFDEAERELLAALRLGGEKMSAAHRFLGALYIERGDAARAVAALETYLRLEPNAREAPQIRDLIKQLRAQAAPGKK